MVTAVAGNQERGGGTVRYGGTLGSKVHYRAFSRYFNRDRMDTTAGPGLDQWSMLRGGFRLDWDPSRDDAVTVEGDLYQGRTGQLTRATTLQPPYALTFGDTARPSGGSLLARWRHTGRGGETQAQLYYDGTRRTDFSGGETVDTCDLDVQHRLRSLGRHDVQFGVDARFTRAALDMKPAAPVRLDPFNDALVGFFAQDEIALVEDRLSLVLGSKFERNGYTGLEVQPGVQLLYTPAEVHSAWASVSRAVRLPALLDRVARMDLAAMPSPYGAGTVLLAQFGNPNLRSETLLAYEAGYRINPAGWFSADLALFYNVYGRLRTSEPGAPFFETTPQPPHLVMPFIAENHLEASTYGLETVANWQPVSRWKLSTSYAWMGAGLTSRSPDPQVERLRADSPRHQAQLRSYLDLPANLSADASVSYTGALAAVPTARPRMPGYARVDALFGWRPKSKLEIAAGVENLLDRRYTEFIETWGTLAAQSVTGRRAYARVTVYF
jgi:iron complex outermembrane receptor protein